MEHVLGIDATLWQVDVITAQERYPLDGAYDRPMALILAHEALATTGVQAVVCIKLPRTGA